MTTQQVPAPDPATDCALPEVSLLFKVIADGHEYEIYTNGSIKGFGEDARVFNYFPRLVRMHLNALNDLLISGGAAGERVRAVEPASK